MLSKIVYNTLSGYLFFIGSCFVYYFLTPLIINTLGKEQFGLWSLIFSIIGFFELLDFGFAVGVVKHVAHYKAKEDQNSLNEILSSTFFSYLGLSSIGILGLGFVGLIFNTFFEIPTDLQSVSLVLLVLLTVRSMCINMPFSLFRGILFGEQRIYLVNFISLASILFYGSGCWWALTHGYGILALGTFSMLSALLENTCYIALGYIFEPHLKIAYRLVSKERLFEMTSFSSMQFLANLSQISSQHLAPILIKLFYSLNGVAFFAISSKLIGYLFRIIKQFTTTLTPLIAHHGAKKEIENVRHILLNGTRYALIPATMLLIGGFIYGKDLINLWIGEGFSLSADILNYLLLAMWISTLQIVATDILGMTGYERIFGRYFFYSTIANIGFSLVFLQLFGVIGAAQGTLATSFFGLTLWLRKACSIYQVKLYQLFFTSLLPHFVSGMADYAVTQYLHSHFPPQHVYEILLYGIPGIAAYVGVFACFLTRSEREILMCKNTKR